jgi:hypothetical protein
MPTTPCRFIMLYKADISIKGCFADSGVFLSVAGGITKRTEEVPTYFMGSTRFKIADGSRGVAWPTTREVRPRAD